MNSNYNFARSVLNHILYLIITISNIQNKEIEKLWHKINEMKLFDEFSFEYKYKSGKDLGCLDSAVLTLSVLRGRGRFSDPPATNLTLLLLTSYSY